MKPVIKRGAALLAMIGVAFTNWQLRIKKIRSPVGSGRILTPISM